MTKLTPDGSGLAYSTFLGGTIGTNECCGEGADAIAIDSTGNAYVTGSSNTQNFPTTAGAFQTSPRGFGQAFVTKLNATGAGLIYSTLLGGSGNPSYGGDNADAIAIDSAGDAYVVGRADSTDFPTTAGSFEATAGSSCENAFVTE